MSDELTPITNESITIIAYTMSYIYQKDKGRGVSTNEIVNVFQERGYVMEATLIERLCEKLFATGVLVKHIDGDTTGWSLIFGRGPAYVA